MERKFFDSPSRWLRRQTRVLVVLFSVAAGMVAGPILTRSVSAAMSAESAAAQQIAIPSPAQLSSEFSKITKQLAPAVVNINTESTVKTGFHMQENPLGDQGPFGDLFDRFMNPGD